MLETGWGDYGSHLCGASESSQGLAGRYENPVDDSSPQSLSLG